MFTQHFFSFESVHLDSGCGLCEYGVSGCGLCEYGGSGCSHSECGFCEYGGSECSHSECGWCEYGGSGYEHTEHSVNAVDLFLSSRLRVSDEQRANFYSRGRRGPADDRASRRPSGLAQDQERQDHPPRRRTEAHAPHRLGAFHPQQAQASRKGYY